MKDDSIKVLLERVKDPVVVVKWRIRIKADTIHVPFEVPVDYDFTRAFSKSKEWFSLSGTLNQEGISINEVSIPNTQRLVVGYQKGRPFVSVTNFNPHLQTEEIGGQLIEIP